MIFRNNNGALVDIKRCDFKNDQLFYTKIMIVKVKKDKKQHIEKYKKHIQPY
jgi:hypothetical protein